MVVLMWMAAERIQVVARRDYAFWKEHANPAQTADEPF
jgi:hypothetical protein